MYIGAGEVKSYVIFFCIKTPDYTTLNSVGKTFLKQIVPIYSFESYYFQKNVFCLAFVLSHAKSASLIFSVCTVGFAP